MDMVIREEEEAAEKERSDFYMNYLITRYAQISPGEESTEYKQERDKLLDTLRPKSKGPALKSSKHEWPAEVMAALEMEE